ncbi:MAG: RHS repeat protein, partial [Bacteroidetes bacterium]
MKRNFLSILFIIPFVIFSFFVNGQTIDFQAKNSFGTPVTGPSPTAAALGKYGEIPVSHYTGTPNISIPLYKATGKQISLPLTLSYHAGGFKVDEVAGNTGLGWSLIAGGAVTRTVRGHADESPNGFFTLPIANPPSSQDLKNAADGTLDTEPDIFYFNFAGYSGKFVFEPDHDFNDPDDQPALIPYQDVLIDVNSSLDSFMITTPDGYIYTFAQIEETQVETQGSDIYPAPVRSAWYLTRIEHPIYNEEILLEYNEFYDLNYISSFNEASYGKPPFEIGDCKPCLQHYSQNLGLNSLSISYQTSIGYYLTKITTATSTIEIDYLGGRLDLPGGKMVDKISVYGTDGTTRMRYFTFAYDYFTATGYNIPSLEKPEHKKRLKLLSVSEHTGDDSLPPKVHSFTYFEGSRFDLPPRLSMKQDHWGFANQNSASTLIPKNLVFAEFANGADRSPDASGSQANVLKQITYPTGGHSRFVFEAHRYGTVDTLDNPTCLLEYVENPLVYAVGDPNNSPVIDTFSVDIDQFTTISSYLYGPVQGDIVGFAIIEKKDGSGNWQSYWSAPISEFDSQNPPQPIQDETTVLLVEGDYRIYIDIVPGETARISVPTQSLICNDPSQGTDAMAGGVRIKQIIHNDGEKDMIQTYEYLNPNDSLKSSGVLIQQPRYFSEFAYIAIIACTPYDPPQNFPCNYPMASSVSKSPLGATQGSHVGYLNARMYYGTKTENEGYSDFTYSFDSDQGQPGFPFGDITSYDWKRGHLLHQKDISKTGATVREVTNVYDFREQQSLNNEEVTAFRVANFYANSSNTAGNLQVYKDYEHLSRWYYLTQTTEILDNVTKVIDYDYDPAGKHTNPVSISTTNSDDIEHELKYYYGTDGQGASCLGNKHIINTPYKIEKIVADTVVSGSRTGYNTSCEPIQFYEILEGGSELLRGSISSYTADGFPNDYTKMGFAPEVYTWEDGLMTEKDFHSWHWEYQYDTIRRLPIYAMDIDSIESYFAYDGFQRLSKGGTRVKSGVSSPDATNTSDFHIHNTYSYTYGSPNVVSTQTLYSDGPTQTIIQELDGLGRHFRTTHNGVIKEELIFNEFGQVWKEQFLPEEEVYGKTWKFYEYDGSPLNRVVKTIFPDGNFTQTQFGNEGKYYKVTTLDELNQATSVNTDIIGRQSRITNAIGGITSYEYYNHGGVKNIHPPLGDPYHYKYDTRKRLQEKTIPGGGTQTFTYDDATDLLQTTTDANLNVLTFGYDDYGRQDSVWLTNASFSQEIIKTTTYGESQGGINVGKVMQTTAKVLDGSGTVTNSFAYDDYGRVNEQSDSYPKNGGLPGTDKHYFQYNHLDWLLENTRNHTAHLTFRVFSNNEYDDFGRLTSTSAIAPDAPGLEAKGSQVVMEYNDRDEMTFKGLQPFGPHYLEPIDYEYHIRSWLTDINKTRIPLADGTDKCGDPVIQSPTQIQVEETVDFSELLDLICLGEDIAIEDIDPCQEGECHTALWDYYVKWTADIGPHLVSITSSTGQVLPLNLSAYVLSESFPPTDGDTLEADIASALTQLGYVYGEVIVRTAHSIYDISITITATNFDFGTAWVKKDLNDPAIPMQFYDPYNPQSVLCEELEGGFDNTIHPDTVVAQADVLIAAADTSNLTIPDVLYQVGFSNGEKRWLFLQELSQIQGVYTRLERIHIQETDEKLITKLEGQSESVVLLSTFLNQRTDTLAIEWVDRDTAGGDCDPQPLGCTPTEITQQNASVEDIKVDMCNLDVESLNYPVTLHLVRLCDGTTTYILSSFITDITGTYVLVDSIEV